TRVPSPGRVRMSNSFTSRFAPPSPRPSPLPVVKPSFNACSTSAIPGPWSSKTSRRPRLGPSFRLSSSTTPPPPYSTTLRATWRAAVTTFVWSTRLNPSPTAHSRTACRTPTTSSELRTRRVSCRTTAIATSRRRRAGDELHAAFHVQRRRHAFERETELDERDRDRRSHADDDRARVEDACHRRDVREHAADEGVDD